MSMPQVIALLGGLLALAFAANRLSSWTKVPDVVVLLTVGLLFGPVFKLLQPSQFQTVTPILGTLALILVLFEGGLELNLRETFHHFPGSLLLANPIDAFGRSVDRPKDLSRNPNLRNLCRMTLAGAHFAQSALPCA